MFVIRMDVFATFSMLDFGCAQLIVSDHLLIRSRHCPASIYWMLLGESVWHIRVESKGIVVTKLLGSVGTNYAFSRHHEQNNDSAEQRQEDTLAQRWDRLLQDRAAISADVLTEFARIFAAADGEDFQSQRVVCVAVAEFYDAANVCRSDRITTVLLRDRKTL